MLMTIFSIRGTWWGLACLCFSRNAGTTSFFMYLS